MIRRLFRLAVVATLGRAWAQRSPRWLSLGAVLVLFRLIDSRASKSAKRAKRQHA